ncbi:MAG: DUF11 domain-containing protein, partial [Acidimicrobiales bacterium]
MTLAFEKARAGRPASRRRVRTSLRPLARRSTAAFAVLAVLLPSLATVAILSSPASATIPPIAMTFYVPIAEAQVIDTYEELTGNNAGSVVSNVVSIISTQDSAVISYDHWEDGYEVDARNPVQASTEVWGDGDAANGCASARRVPPILPCTDLLDSVAEGDVFIVEDNIEAQPRDPSNLFFDGGDRIDASSFIVVSQASQPETINGNPGSLIGGAVQVYDTLRYGANFTVPLGEDLTDAKYNRLAEFTTLFVMAAEDGTVVTIDTDADGTTDITQTLNAGEAIHVDGDLTTGTLVYPGRTDYNFGEQINAGATISATSPVQAYMAAASLESNYQARFFELVPSTGWDTTYFAPISTQATTGTNTADASLFLFNPSPNPITVTLTYSDFSTTDVVVPAGGNEIATLPVAQTNSGVRLDSTEIFFAVALVDTNDSTSTSDWGLTLLPASGQTRTMKAGWAPGSADVATENSNPIWLVSSDDARIYIDYDGDGVGAFTAPNGEAFDLEMDVVALELVRIFESDNDQTGVRVFSLDSTRLSGAWGQDGSVASAGSPGLDMGTTVFPGPSVGIGKVATVQIDLNGNGLADPGDTIRYAATIKNDSTVAATDIVVVDTSDPNVIYVPNSTFGNGVSIPDELSPETPFPLDGAGYLGPLVGPGTEFQYTYDMLIDPDTDPLTTELINTITMFTSAGNGIASALIRLKWPSLAVVKKNDDADGIVDPGQVVTYTVELTNTDLLTQTNINVSDLLPAGMTYVAESTVATGTSSDLVTHTARDEFSSVSYSNSDGSDPWAGDWIEFDENNGPADSRISITGGQLWLDDIDKRQLSRAVDLSDPTITITTLTLDYDVTNLGNEVLAVELWNGTTWDEVITLESSMTTPAGTISHTLTAPQTSANTQVRFRAQDDKWDGGEEAFIDNVEFSWDIGSTTSVVLDNVPGGINADLVEGDPELGNLVVPADGFVLASNDKLTITYQGTVDSDASFDLVNAATVVSTESPDPASESSTVTVDQPVELVVDRIDTLIGTGDAGDTIDYAITVTNPTNLPITDIDLVDSLGDANLNLTCTPVEPFSLAAGMSATCTSTHTITQAEVDAGEVLGFVTATGTDYASEVVSDLSDDPDDATDADTNGNGNPDDPTITPLPQTPELQVTKVDTLNGTGIAGDTVDYDITIANTGNVTVDNIGVSDTLGDANVSLICTPPTPGTLAPGETFTCTSTHTVTQGEVDLGQVSSTAVATGTDPGSNVVTDIADDPDDLSNVDLEADGEPDDPTITPLLQTAVLDVEQTDVLVGTGIAGDTID